MNDISSLPRPFQQLIENSLPKTLKAYNVLQDKLKSVDTLNNYMVSNIVPRSFRFKVGLVFPQCLNTDPINIALNDKIEKEFKDELTALQQYPLMKSFSKG